MNNFMIYIDGMLAPPEIFQVKTGNSAQFGRYADLFKDDDDEKKSKETAIDMPSAPQIIDIIEIRAGSMVRRYHCQPDEQNVELFKATEESPGRTKWRCSNVVNSF